MAAAFQLAPLPREAGLLPGAVLHILRVNRRGRP